MAEESVERTQQKPKGMLHIPCDVIKTLLVSLVLSIVVEWLCIAFIWPEQGYQHSKNVMTEGFHYFSQEFQRSILYAEPAVLGKWLLSQTYYWLFQFTGIEQWLHHPGTNNIVRSMAYYLNAYVQSALYVTMTFIIRVLIILFTSPFFLLAGLIGLVEGLVQRDLRRFGVGRESAFKYHHAKRWVMPSMLMAWVVYLSVPFSVHPNIILIPAAVLFGLTIAFTASNFKKYL